MKKAILDFLGKMFMTRATITKIEAPSPKFRLITFDVALKDWKPGDKIQLNAGDWNVRTYTPFSCTASSMKILVYLHSEDTPGPRWARSAKVGDSVQYIGPRTSIDFNTLSAPVVFFGDETSLGVAQALKDKVGEQAAIIIESKNELSEVIAALDLKGLKAVPPEQTESALNEALSATPGATLVFTGNAKAIQRAQKFVKAPKKTKAYWAEGKVGLD